MASVQKVQSYLAYWFQLGKPLIFEKTQTECLPQPIFQGNQLSEAFEQCWQKVSQHPAKCHLRGTDESIADLLSDEWEIVGCARCPMPFPALVRGIKVSPCPCADLPSWPNDEIPQPRSAVNDTGRLANLRQRLDNRLQEDRDRLQNLYRQSPTFPQVKRVQPQPNAMPPEQQAPDAR